MRLLRQTQPEDDHVFHFLVFLVGDFPLVLDLLSCCCNEKRVSSLRNTCMRAPLVIAESKNIRSSLQSR